jgi:hypothetical protein
MSTYIISQNKRKIHRIQKYFQKNYNYFSLYRKKPPARRRCGGEEASDMDGEDQ